jgi:nicotinamide-nucleotide amidase
VAASAGTPQAARALAQPVEDRLREALFPHVYGADDESLPVVVGRLLASRGESLATLESLTGGLVADELTNVPGASAYLLGGGVAYGEAAKASFGVRPETLEEFGAVSGETALELAEAAGSAWRDLGPGHDRRGRPGAERGEAGRPRVRRPRRARR